MFKITPDVEQQIDRLTRKLSSTVKEANGESAVKLFDVVKENIRRGYRDEVLGLNSSWKWLSEQYWEMLGRPTKDEHPGLVLTGQLLESVRIEEKEDRFIVKVTDWKAIVHEYGLQKDLPARPFFGPATFHFEEKEIAKKILDKNIKRVLS